MPARGVMLRWLLVVSVLGLLALPAGASAGARPGCFLGLDVSRSFDRDPSPCVPVDTGGAALSGPVASGPGAGRVTAFAGREALTFDAKAREVVVDGSAWMWIRRAS